MAAALLFAAPASATPLAPGRYEQAGHPIYVGVQREGSDWLRVANIPVLALYGARDRNVDTAEAALQLKAWLKRAGNRDVTVRVWPDAGHQLIVSTSGFNGDAIPPQRFVQGYPQVMLDWLTTRGLVASTRRLGPVE